LLRRRLSVCGGREQRSRFPPPHRVDAARALCRLARRRRRRSCAAFAPRLALAQQLLDQRFALSSCARRWRGGGRVSSGNRGRRWCGGQRRRGRRRASGSAAAAAAAAHLLPPKAMLVEDRLDARSTLILRLVRRISARLSGSGSGSGRCASHAAAARAAAERAARTPLRKCAIERVITTLPQLGNNLLAPRLWDFSGAQRRPF